MKRLTLLRHAKSSWDHPELRDIDRPLNSRGRRDAPLMGQVCRDNLPAPDLVLLSPSRRTRETVEAFLESWGMGHVPSIVDDRLYGAGISEWDDVVSGHADSTRHILGCAHQPGIGDFACWLDASYSADVPTAAVISFSIPGGELHRDCADLEFYGIPKAYR